MADETQSRMFDISSQSKQKLRSKRRSEIVKSTLINTEYPNLFHGFDLLGFTLPVRWIINVFEKSQSKTRLHHFFHQSHLFHQSYNFLSI